MTGATTSAQPAPRPVHIWSADQLRVRLLDPVVQNRLTALAMAVMPEAPSHECVAELVDCTRLDNPLAQRLAAVALAATPANEANAGALTSLLADGHELAVRVAAAHGLYRIGVVPESAHAPLAELLVIEDATARQVAHLAFTRAGESAAETVARRVGESLPETWNNEILATLAHFAQTVEARQQLTAWLRDALANAPLLPTAIAGFTALARLGVDPIGVDALVKIVEESPEPAARMAALNALGSLGETATPCAAKLAKLLNRPHEADFEIALCQALVKIRAPTSALPMATLTERLTTAVPPVAVAYAMLITLGGRQFARAAKAIEERHQIGPEPLRPALTNAYYILTGNTLAEGPTH